MKNQHLPAHTRGRIFGQASLPYRLLTMMRDHRWYTNTRMQKNGGFSYTSRVSNLRAEGYVIVSVQTRNKSAWKYMLIGRLHEFTGKDTNPTVLDIDKKYKNINGKPCVVYSMHKKIPGVDRVSLYTEAL